MPVVVVRQTALGAELAEHFLSDGVRLPIGPTVLALFRFTGVVPHGTEVRDDGKAPALVKLIGIGSCTLLAIFFAIRRFPSVFPGAARDVRVFAGVIGGVGVLDE